jgi:hypothetical protein
MVMMFLGGVVLVIDGNLLLFLVLCKIDGVGVFVPAGGNIGDISKSSDTSKLLAMFWRLCICISLFVRTNRASTYMFICQTNTDIQIDGHVECFFSKKYL